MRTQWARNKSFVLRTPVLHTYTMDKIRHKTSLNCIFFIKIKWVSSNSFILRWLIHFSTLLRAHCVHGMLTSCRGVRTPPPHTQLLEPPGHSVLSSAPRMWSAIFKFLFSGKSDVCRSCKALCWPSWLACVVVFAVHSATVRGRDRSPYCDCNPELQRNNWRRQGL